jgi:hypothetical protein
MSKRVKPGRCSGVSAALSLLALSISSQAYAGPPQLYLSWRQPYGMPRATEAITVACGDTNRVDTLFLSFDAGQTRPGLASMSAVVYFGPMLEDTLGDFWAFGRQSANALNMLIDFDSGTGIPGPRPWSVIGYGKVAYDRTSGRGRLDLDFRVDPNLADPLIRDNRYCYARIRIQHKRSHLSGCSQPICVEWARAHMKFAGSETRSKELDITRGGSRYVTWNSRDGSVCRPYRRAVARPWQPPPKPLQARK